MLHLGIQLIPYKSSMQRSNQAVILPPLEIRNNSLDRDELGEREIRFAETSLSVRNDI